MSQKRYITAAAVLALAGLALWAWMGRAPVKPATPPELPSSVTAGDKPTHPTTSKPAIGVQSPQAVAAPRNRPNPAANEKPSSPTPIADLVERLRRTLGDSANSESAAEAHAIMRELLARGRESLPFLVQIASDRSAPILLRQYAVLLLGRIGDPAASASLLAVAQEPGEGEDLRAAALVALSKLGGVNLAEGLRKILETEQPGRISDLCLGALGALDEKTAVDTLYEASQNPEYQTRSMAAISLGDLAANTNHFVQTDAALAVANVGLAVVDELAARAAEAAQTPPAERAIAEDQYRWMKETETARTDSEIAVEMLSTVYAFASEQDARLARDAVAGLGGCQGSRQAVSVLGIGLRDPNPMVRMVAARSLLLARGGQAADIVNAAIADESDARVRRDMQTALDETKTVKQP